MRLYSRPQLWLLFTLAGIFLTGLAVREWRAGFPDDAERLERFDRQDPPPLLPAMPAPRRRAPEAEIAGRQQRQGPAAPDRGTSEPHASKKSATRPTEAVPDAGPLDLNQASAAELARLPGIGPGLAQRIVLERERRGRFDSPNALRRVLGLGPKKLAGLQDLVTVGE